MSTEKKDKEAKPKKGKGMIIKIAMALGLVGAGGGGVFAMVQSGMVGGGKAAVKEDNRPKLIRKGEEDPFAPKAEGGKEGEGAADVEGDGGSEYRTVYYGFAEEFTSNLQNSTALIQVSLACSTRRDGRVLLWLKKHELAIRSEMLVVLADTPEEDAHSSQGKERLQKRLTAAINKVLTETEGFGGIDAVYFKSFLVQ
ncbi:flagellar basal body-associated FliL family protein [Novosphingobium lentum]|uniref:flagellar basal body-associated FliL family protein n=1 Tax=Novosphingobium lentum TaxID=145287 RepID=UPI00083626D7|nr:flagellar basal body-associated FliL family protein [Novosphingobium lentum]